jgi:hypothetical protein
LETYLDGINASRAPAGRDQQPVGESMRRGVLQLYRAVLRHLAVPGLALLIGIGSATAQSGDSKGQDASGKPAAASAAPADVAKDNQRKTDEFAEAAQAINGPAGNPECVWFGRRVVRLMWLDDIDTALRHLDLYDRFGCPGGHVQATFRCLTRFGAQIDPKVARRSTAGFMPAGSIPPRYRRRPPRPRRRLPEAPRRLPPRGLRSQRLRRHPRPPNNPNRRRNDPEFLGFAGCAPSKRHGVIRVVKSRGRDMLQVPLTRSDLGDGSASPPYWPQMV